MLYYSWYSILNVCGWAVLDRGFFPLCMWISIRVFYRGFGFPLRRCFFKLDSTPFVNMYVLWKEGQQLTYSIDYLWQNAEGGETILQAEIHVQPLTHD